MSLLLLLRGGSAGSVSGTASITTADDVSSATGSTTVNGSVSVTTGDDNSNASGSISVTGLANVTTGDDVSSASGSSVITGFSSVTTADDTSEASGNAGNATGTVNVTTGDDIATAFGIVPQDNLFGGVAHFEKLAERSKKLRELELQQRTEAPTSDDVQEVDAIPQEVKEVIAKVAKIDNEEIQRKQLKAQLKALEIQFKKEYAEALRNEMIRNYLVMEMERQEEEADIAFIMMSLV